MARHIFISYRRGEDSGFAGRLFDSLQTAFDSDQLFMDVDSIEPGTNFVRVLQQKIAESDIVLAIIGRNWTDVTDSKGNRRLDNPKDFVRTEIEAALNQEKIVIPVLLGDAEMPTPERLPETLRVLTELHALRINHERFRADAEGLIKSLKKILDRPPRAETGQDSAGHEPVAEESEPDPRQRVQDANARLKRLQDELEPYVSGSSSPASTRVAAAAPSFLLPGESQKPSGGQTTEPKKQSGKSLESPRALRTAHGSGQSSVSPIGKENGLGKTSLLILGVVAVFAVSLVVLLYGPSMLAFLGQMSEKPATEAALKQNAPVPLPPKQDAPTQPSKSIDRSAQLPPGSQAATPVAQRVVLYDEDPSAPNGKQYVGTVVWRTEPVKGGAGKPADIAVRADIDIPDRKFKMTMAFRRNTDTSLPASHTAEITFVLPPDFAGGGVANVPGILMKSDEKARGTPLAGLAVKVTDGFFLIGLSAVDADRARNIQLLKERPWFDVPLVYVNQRRAIIAIEKGTPGERAFNDAFAAWGE